jgi:putative redox protein
MIEATSEMPRYRTRISDGTHQATSDTTADKGGDGAGFRPHDLLEAALAGCMNMTVRMYAEKHAFPLRNVTTIVHIDRTDPAETVFRYDVRFEGDLSQQQEQRLMEAVSACPVRRTLSKPIRFATVSDN